MAKLITNSPFGDSLPIRIGSCFLTALEPAAITSVAVQKGQEKVVSAALRKSHGLAFPAANRATGNDGGRCVWVGPGQGLLLGRAVSKLNGASISDQSDGWAMMQLEGADAEAVLARLVPVDLRLSVFKRGFAAKTLLFHMPLVIWRSGSAAFDLMVFRSMAVTAVHELKLAMQSVSAQQALKKGLGYE